MHAHDFRPRPVRSLSARSGRWAVSVATGFRMRDFGAAIRILPTCTGAGSPRSGIGGCDGRRREVGRAE
jgi:hypothetical protein